jgi:hypothetical protein
MSADAILLWRLPFPTKEVVSSVKLNVITTRCTVFSALSCQITAREVVCPILDFRFNIYTIDHNITIVGYKFLGLGPSRRRMIFQIVPIRQRFCLSHGRSTECIRPFIGAIRRELWKWSSSRQRFSSNRSCCPQCSIHVKRLVHVGVQCHNLFNRVII